MPKEHKRLNFKRLERFTEKLDEHPDVLGVIVLHKHPTGKLACHAKFWDDPENPDYPEDYAVIVLDHLAQMAARVERQKASLAARLAARGAQSAAKHAELMADFERVFDGKIEDVLAPPPAETVAAPVADVPRDPFAVIAERVKARVAVNARNMNGLTEDQNRGADDE